MKIIPSKILYPLFLIAGIFISQYSVAQFYNGTKVAFGKNRVQYDSFEWQFYRFSNFETYFYTGGKDLAVHTAEYANVRLDEMQKFLDFYLDEPIQFVIYNKQSHFRQSNIGLSTTENYNIGGVTQIVGSKVFVYFDGSYESFEKQIDAGLLEVLVYQMIYGGNWREVLRNSTLLSVPDWYIKGLVSYFSYPDDPLINARIKDGVMNGDFDRFNSLTRDEARIVGHAMWQYIADTYGEKVISNILYMTRISREVDDGFLYVIGVPFNDLYDECVAYYKTKYSGDEKRSFSGYGEEIQIKKRKNRRFQNFTSSSNGKYVAYSTNKMGQYKIYLLDTQSNKQIKIFQDEHKLERLQDYSYPIIEWHPSGRLVTFITEDKGEVLFHTYNIEDKELSRKPIFKIEKILSYDYLSDGKQFVFSGLNEGKTDLYLYSVLGNTQQKLTNDFYDDLNPVVNQEDNKIYFTSNRNNDSLNTDHKRDIFSHEKDIFVYDLSQEENQISSVTDTDGEDESNALVSGNQLYYLIQDKNRVKRFTAKYDSAVSKIDTIVHYRYFYNTAEFSSFKSPVLTQSSNTENYILQSFYDEGKYKLFRKESNETGNVGDLKNDIEELNFVSPNKESFTVIEKKEPEKEVDIYNYTFSSSAKEEKQTIAEVIQQQEEDTIADLKFPTQRIYRLNFRPDNSVLQLNNSFINGQYQLFNGGPYINSGLGINTKIGIVDLMEDHRIYGGFRYAGELIEYSLSYQNLKKQLDKEYIIMRTRERNTGGFNPFDIKTLKGIASFSYPFSEITSAKWAISARNDKVVPLSVSQRSLETDIFNEYWASVKLGYVYDNTREIATNILNGTRMNFFAEHYRLVYSENATTQAANLSVIGFDVRHYQKIHRELTFVARVAGSKSFGNRPLIYYLGGVDSWWSQNIFDDSTPIDFSQNYNYQALAANLRGFKQNIRNGNSFVVVNTELRWPIISYFVNKPIQSVFLRNFQVVGFGDIGTAWTGKSPFAEDNPLNNETQTISPITVTYENVNDPVVGGVGFGLRSTLFGYFVRTDWAWGIENGEISDKPQFILSLSLDI